MNKDHFKFSTQILAWIFVFLISLGNSECSRDSANNGAYSVSGIEIKPHCKQYASESDQVACSTYCDSNKKIKENNALVKACEFGQTLATNPAYKDQVTLLDECDVLTLDGAAASCRDGALQEQLRLKSLNQGIVPGQASDKEIGK